MLLNFEYKNAISLEFSGIELLLYQQFLQQKRYIEGRILRYFHQLHDVERLRYIGLIFPSKKISELQRKLYLMMLLALCMAFLRLLEEYPLVELAIIALVSLCIYHHFFAVRPVNLHGKSSSPFTKLLKKHMPILNGFYS